MEAFLEQYQFNIDLAPNRTQLQCLTQKSTQSFKQYALKWRKLASRVQPPMMEREMIDIFTNTLQNHYFVACSSSSRFTEMVTIGECIESGLKIRKIQFVNTGASTSSGGKKYSSVTLRKRKGRPVLCMVEGTIEKRNDMSMLYSSLLLNQYLSNNVRANIRGNRMPQGK